MKRSKTLPPLVASLVLLGACAAPVPTVGVPETSSSAITSPPPEMEGINTHTHLYGTGADPEMITLGPRTGGQPGWEPYPGKTSMEFELAHGTPVLAPIDMVFTGFRNNNASYRIQDDQKYSPYNDLSLSFESANPEWPGMIINVYHMFSTPLLTGHNIDPDCIEVEEWGSTTQAQGRQVSESNDYTIPGNGQGKAGSCGALIGRAVKRGELIGYAGSVGIHSMAAFRFKVQYPSKNPTVGIGNRYLHWVQPGSFFYWKCYSPDAEFPAGVLAYPFECGGYRLPAEQRGTDFKYAQE